MSAAFPGQPAATSQMLYGGGLLLLLPVPGVFAVDTSKN